MEEIAHKESLEQENRKLKGLLRLIYEDKDAIHHLDDDTYASLERYFKNAARNN